MLGRVDRAPAAVVCALAGAAAVSRPSNTQFEVPAQVFFGHLSGCKPKGGGGGGGVPGNASHWRRGNTG